MSKLQELILYIARRSEDDRHFGANKLKGGRVGRAQASLRRG